MGGLFELASRQTRLKAIGELEAQETFWQDAKEAAKIQKEKSLLKKIIDGHNALKELYDEFEILYEYSQGEDAERETAQEAIEMAEKFAKELQKAEQKAFLSEDLDSNNAIVNINSGAGGIESCDWAEMLYRMITRWAESRGFKINTLDVQEGDSAGIKSVTFIVEGDYASGLLKSETGVHRLVRISPFDAKSRRHTSFASIFVSPEVDESVEIEINEKELKIDVYRSGGAGGQSVNTTDSAVRITHLPTGIVVTCQNERSQHQNKQQAMNVLKSRLYDLAMEEKRAKENKLAMDKKKIEWGAQIRSYVLYPYKMAKDHRSEVETSNVEKCLDGGLDPFIDGYLRWRLKGGTS